MADNAVSAAVILVEAVSSFISQEINLQTNVQTNIDRIRAWLTMMQAYLNDHQATEANQLLQDRVRQIRDCAHEIEDIIEEFMFHVPHNFHRHGVTRLAHDLYHHVSQRKALLELTSRIQDLEQQIQSLKTLSFLHPNNGYVASSSSTTTMCSAPVSSWTRQHQEELVGFGSLQNRILHQLLSVDSCRVTLSIVGPPGSGKTALVKNVYQHPSVSGKFQCRAWVRCSRSLRRKETLSSIIAQINGNVGDDLSRGVLHKHLLLKKYFIVLDDVWRKEDWTYIDEVLPRGLKGSRIIVTSCNNDVAASCAETQSHVHQLKGLTWKDARNLFCKKAFPTTNGECPPELEVFAGNIVKKCEGSPLAITTVGGFVGFLLLDFLPQLLGISTTLTLTHNCN